MKQQFSTLLNTMVSPFNIILAKHSHIPKISVEHHDETLGMAVHRWNHQSSWTVDCLGQESGDFYPRCVLCHKLRGKLDVLKMVDLPSELLDPSPPFTYIGWTCSDHGQWWLDAPEEVRRRKEKGGPFCSLLWAPGGTHIEVIESIYASSCINALRRFLAIRGPTKRLRGGMYDWGHLPNITLYAFAKHIYSPDTWGPVHLDGGDISNHKRPQIPNSSDPSLLILLWQNQQSGTELSTTYNLEIFCCWKRVKHQGMRGQWLWSHQPLKAAMVESSMLRLEQHFTGYLPAAHLWWHPYPWERLRRHELKEKSEF